MGIWVIVVWHCWTMVMFLQSHSDGQLPNWTYDAIPNVMVLDLSNKHKEVFGPPRGGTGSYNITSRTLGTLHTVIFSQSSIVFPFYIDIVVIFMWYTAYIAICKSIHSSASPLIFNRVIRLWWIRPITYFIYDSFDRDWRLETSREPGNWFWTLYPMMSPKAFPCGPSEQSQFLRVIITLRNYVAS